MNFDFRRGIVYLNNSEKVNMFDFGVDSLEVYYDDKEIACNDKFFNYKRSPQNIILKCNRLEFNIKDVFNLSDDEFMKILNNFLKVKESICKIKECETIIEGILEEHRERGMIRIGYKRDKSYIKCNKIIDDNCININNTINELKRYFLVIDRSEFYMEGTYYKYVIE